MTRQHLGVRKGVSPGGDTEGARALGYRLAEKPLREVLETLPAENYQVPELPGAWVGVAGGGSGRTRLLAVQNPPPLLRQGALRPAHGMSPGTLAEGPRRGQSCSCWRRSVLGQLPPPLLQQKGHPRGTQSQW